MSRGIGLPLLFGLAFSTATSSSIAAPSSAPGSTPTVPYKLTITPPPGKPDKLTAPATPQQTGPGYIVIFPGKGARSTSPPKPLDDLLGTNGPKRGPVIGGSHFGPVRPPSPPPKAIRLAR